MVGLALQLVLVGIPWVTVGDHPAVMLDLGARRAYVLGEIFTARDTPYLLLIGLFSAFSLFLFTSLYGRIWCGYACPQTVYLEEWVRPIERFFEGERPKRMARDRAGVSWDRVWRKSGKWLGFAGVAGGVAMSFMAWFAGARALWSGTASPMEYGITAALAGVMFLDFAWFREQFCNYLCPYARFQGALSDEESLAVAYDATRGEPRRGLGDCTGCSKCEQVCPQGIDIREGFQLECIACGRCIDACTPIMAKKGKASLIAYTSLKKARTIRPRTVAYSGLLLAIAAAFIGMLLTRTDVQASVARAPGPLYVIDNDGFVRNTFMLRVVNTDPVAHSYSVSMGGLPDQAELMVPPLTVEAGEMGVVPVVVRIPSANRERTLELTFTVSSGNTHSDVVTTFKTEASS
jgi:cytochrome c oxidase accessory protein FixG